jgi:lipopolysaccharide transport protein LptA
MGFIKALRITVAVLLVLVLALIVRYFLTRSSGGVRIPVQSDEVTQKNIEKKEKIELVEYKAEEESLHVKADEHYMGDDKDYHAEGNVEIVFVKEREGKDVILYGDKVVYDKDMTRFVSSGQGRVKFKDLVVESVLLNYDNKREVFSTETGASFFSQRLKGSAHKMTYQMRQERLRLQGNVRLQIIPRDESSPHLEVTGEKLDYSEKNKKGKIEGGVELFRGESRASAEIMKFEMYPDGEQIKSLILEKSAWASLVEGESRPSEKHSPLFDQSARREIEGKEITLKFYQDPPVLQEVEARGSSSFKFISSDESFTWVRAESGSFGFDKEGELTEFRASKNARIVKQANDPDETRLIEGDVFTKKRDSDVLWVQGEGPYEARVSSRENDVLAEEMFISLDNNDLEAKGGVKVIMEAKEGGGKPIGIFSGEQPVFIQAREMRYFAEHKRFLFNKRVKAWQEKKVLRTDEIELFEETGKILCRGGVESTMPHSTKEGEEEKLKISSEKMTYFPEENLVLYQNKSSLTVKNATLQAQSISVFMGEEDNGIQKIVARKKVVIVQDLGEARGEKAEYNPENELLVLLGNPVLIDKEGGRTEGHKLTFHMADDRILVENKDRERSVTVIKRER